MNRLQYSLRGLLLFMTAYAVYAGILSYVRPSFVLVFANRS